MDSIDRHPSALNAILSFVCFDRSLNVLSLDINYSVQTCVSFSFLLSSPLNYALTDCDWLLSFLFSLDCNRVRQTAFFIIIIMLFDSWSLSFLLVVSLCETDKKSASWHDSKKNAHAMQASSHVMPEATQLISLYNSVVYGDGDGNFQYKSWKCCLSWLRQIFFMSSYKSWSWCWIKSSCRHQVLHPLHSCSCRASILARILYFRNRNRIFLHSNHPLRSCHAIRVTQLAKHACRHTVIVSVVSSKISG